MLVVCLLGVSLGILWGAMPGLSTTMAMALLIGLSVGMSQYVAIMFMVYDFSSPLPMPRRIRQSPSANTQHESELEDSEMVKCHGRVAL